MSQKTKNKVKRSVRELELRQRLRDVRRNARAVEKIRHAAAELAFVLSWDQVEVEDQLQQEFGAVDE